MMLAHAKVQYKNVCVEGKDWPALKSTMPNGAMPCVELKDGKKIAQS
jgi:hypothetical protein